MNSIDFSLKLNQFPIDEAKKELKEIQALSDSDFKKYVENQKKAIVQYHLQHNTFYQSLVKTDDPNWNDLPVLAKKDLQIPLIKRLSRGYTPKNCYINKTSGSTGDPFYFAKDKFTHALTWTVIQNRFNWHNLYGKKQARFYGIPKDKKGYYKERIKDLFANRYRFNVFDLSDRAFESWIRKFKKNKYVFLNGYTTVIVAFAEFLIQKNIVLKNICPTISAAVVTSEMCSEEDKILMQKAFGIPVINEYGASELDLIAFQNTQDQWVINNETLFVEVLDQNNQPLPNGEVGKLVISSLYNKAHPFIRYELGDMGSIKKLDDKTVVLEKLEGRKEDLVRLPSGKVAPGLTFYYVTKSIMKDNGLVKEIKVTQTALDTFEIHYSSITELNNNQKLDITNALHNYLEPNLNVQFIYFTQLERSKSGKLKQFTSFIEQ
ncbi:phenylacetate--CoA ligase family protein [Pseudofulvibacter geojedonensis]|uniref:Phenylacetate--CoA ligase family protein n=1 Tax=Pseudofulvibacter geojedonensis TaxID=1123758 RepID=A0ABW3I3X9_9FLAO